MIDYKVDDGKVLIGDFDNLKYWRPIRDEEKIDVMLQMIIDLHVKFNRLKDI